MTQEMGNDTISIVIGNKRDGKEDAMVDIDRLQGELVANRITKPEMAEKLGISTKTFYARLKKGCFMTNEIDKMVEILKLDRDLAINIFFAQKVSQDDTLH